MKISKADNISDIKVIILCLLLSIVIFIIDSSIPLGVAGGVPYILVVLISLWSEKKSLPVLAAILGSILTVVGFYSSPHGGELWKVLFNRALALFAIWTTAVLSMQRNVIMEERRRAFNDREKAFADLKVLKGLLPICSSCKKIRDSKGYWNQIESYIREHSEVEFSHGLCEECTEKLYGDEAWYKKMKNSPKK